MKKVDLSISPDYVCSWKLWEAFRELMQNAQDAEKEGHALSVTYVDNILSISNEGASLSLSSLVLGNSVKEAEDAIGKYGEGYKLALVVLLRLGYDVTIYNGDEIWKPRFSYSELYESEVLSFIIGEGGAYNGVTFEIMGVSVTDLNLLRSKSLVLDRLLGSRMGKTVESEYGVVLLDPSYSGMFFVEGLFIQQDTNFKYGYSFNSSVVQLDRDRRAINYYDLLDLTVDVLVSQDKDFSIVETSLVNNYKDTYSLTNFYRDVSNEFASGYAKHFIEKHEIDEETFVGTEKEVLVSGSTKTLAVSEIQAKIVNKGLGVEKESEYLKVKDLAKQKNNKDTAWTYYQKHSLYQLHKWLVGSCKRMSTKKINEFLDIIENIQPTDFRLIREDVYSNLIDDITRVTDGRYKGGYTYGE